MRPVRLPPPPEATTASGSALLLALSLSHWLSLTPAGTPFAAPCSRRPPRPRSVRRPVRPPFFLISAARLCVLCGTPSSPEPARPTAETVRHGDGERCRPWRSCRGPLARLLSVARPASGERSAAACSLSCSLSSLSARLDAQHASCRAARARPREPRCRPRPDVDHPDSSSASLATTITGGGTVVSTSAAASSTASSTSVDIPRPTANLTTGANQDLRLWPPVSGLTMCERVTFACVLFPLSPYPRARADQTRATSAGSPAPRSPRRCAHSSPPPPAHALTDTSSCARSAASTSATHRPTSSRSRSAAPTRRSRPASSAGSSTFLPASRSSSSSVRPLFCTLEHFETVFDT